VSAGHVDEVVLVGGSTRIPRVRAMLQEVFLGKKLHHSINPDEAVAYGAAVHAAVLAGDRTVKNLVNLRDVTPLSLGIAVVGDRFACVIPRNTPIPCAKTKHFVTAYDYQNGAECEVGSARIDPKSGWRLFWKNWKVVENQKLIMEFC
jgi:molecular chaperone DnaK (HSP70)